LRQALATGLITGGKRPPQRLQVGDVNLGRWIHSIGRQGVSRLAEEDRKALAEAGFNPRQRSDGRWEIGFTEATTRTEPAAGAYGRALRQALATGAGHLAGADAAMVERASSHGWQASPVPRDGDCLFTSLLAGRGRPALPAQVQQLRQATAHYLETRADSYWANQAFRTYIGDAYMRLHGMAGTQDQVIRWAAALLRTPGNYANEVGDIAPWIAAGALNTTLEILVINNDGSTYVQELNPPTPGQPPRPRQYLVRDAGQLHWMPARRHHP
jgi:hypothetical protein